MENLIKEKVNDYKLSAYTIFIKLKEAEDDYMLIHGYTGAMDIASKELVNYLRSERFDINANSYSEDIIAKLIKRGYVTRKTITEERNEVKKRAILFHRQAKLFKDFTILVTYNCNFRCPYCYENAISKQGICW